MYRLLKRYFKLTPGIVSLTVVSICLVFLCALPVTFHALGSGLFLGIPVPFIAATLLLPIVCFAILWIGARTAEDIDRHDPRYENE